MSQIIDIEDLGFDSGAHILVKQCLASVAPGQDIEIRGQAAEWQTQAAAWCRTQGHGFKRVDDRALISKGIEDKQRWITTSTSATELLDVASPGLGLAARGACVEIGSPEFKFRFDRRDEISTSNAAELYQNAINAQWNPNIAIDWSQPQEHSDTLETAVVQLLTYMVENENAALIVPARFLGQVHPHFREIQALLSIQIADEARHIDVFNRRIALFGRTPGLSTAGGQSSLKTLLDESQFGISEFLLSVLGEGTFVNLLQFLRRFAPDQATRKIALLVAKDESRHVAFGMSHLAERLESDPDYRSTLMAAVRARYDSLAATAGLNEEVFDSLVILAAGSLSPDSIATGFKEVQKLLKDMEEGRLYRVQRLGFSNAEATEISSLHTRNFM
ncbi:MAG TPA: ferritin-like domain-containing protein [Oligoflexus sp.]|uniref:ferritin-like domain-containing protein n=1 Tax=Oligoflexus sp. TaxID=1971216 RepID=UPI002D292671|nr:ferritin-like domain-containing protein [Oligoflexus sp.]HYX34388.1 ferritin-like domain-containing protein [Oligoflexus sp.]